MWGSKKPDSPPAAVPAPSKAQETNTTKPTSAIVEGKVMSTDAVRPLAAAPAGSTARLGASLHIKGEISGNEDLQVDGTVEGLIQLDDRKLTVGASAKVTADLVAREVVVALVGADEATLKRFYREPGGKVRLQPANSEVQPIIAAASEIKIQGRVVGVLRKY